MAPAVMDLNRDPKLLLQQAIFEWLWRLVSCC